MNNTLDFYNKNASSYIEQTKSVNTDNILNRFLLGIPKNGNILDLGCGSGRDSILMHARGYNVIAIDGSKELTDILTTKVKFPVIHANFENYNPEIKFDGIYAMASLLHLNKDDFKKMVNKYVKLLKPDGKIYITLKAGIGESIDEKGRFFSYYTPTEIKEVFNNLDKEILISQSSDSMARETQWLNITCYNNPKKINTFDKDMVSVSQWLSTSLDNVMFEEKIESIADYKNQINEMENSYEEFPQDFKRTEKIYNQINSGSPVFPLFVEKDDEHNFVMEGRHRMVAFKWLGLNEFKVMRVSQINKPANKLKR